MPIDRAHVSCSNTYPTIPPAYSVLGFGFVTIGISFTLIVA